MEEKRMEEKRGRERRRETRGDEGIRGEKRREISMKWCT